ncbi:hypothetical protein SAMN05444280_12329 [Tangfeifania diversioriginum]|uniref:Uncharacterized protein n=1 Tax=Tangfeifania diversioriginum TaxID=1168035 RepID=A0A1M6KFI7_9BACT|nr:hypothetical protein [Tangfeifania diversioriginum]SHJ57745.1 hypothetical protein SAMN05444280_12329 [Tangfeifania diversioriginum]
MVSKLESAKIAKRQLMALLELIEILLVGKSTVKKLLFSDFRNFEDGLQKFCAEEGKLTTIVTRSTKDYSFSHLVIQPTREFLAGLEG